MNAQAQAFLAQLDVERRMSKHTSAAYRRDLALLLAFCDEQDIRDWNDLHLEKMRAFIASQHRRGLAPASLQRLLSACRSFFRWQQRQGLLKVDPTTGLRAPKAARKLPQVLDADEVAQLVEVDVAAPIDARDRAMLELFYSSALRLSELCALRWGDLDLAEGFVRVLGKGNKTRVVPVGRFARAALGELLAARKAKAIDPVFPGRHGAPIGPRAIQKRMKLLALKQGVHKNVHPHLLRHSCASHVLESSGDLRGVQELLGHADIATTQIYTHLDFGHLSKVYDAAHPRAKRKP